METSLTRSIQALLRQVRRDERGVTLVEYGIAILLAIVVGTGALVGLAGEIDATLGQAEACLAGTAAC
jgi:Flp pilus assembly pilin Flp